jgi:hypothetical protein
MGARILFAASAGLYTPGAAGLAAAPASEVAALGLFVQMTQRRRRP